eukprot:SAG25_NODE_12846_length_274_cov_0.942857_1_plen_21_part_01
MPVVQLVSVGDLQPSFLLAGT